MSVIKTTFGSSRRKKARVNPISRGSNRRVGHTGRRSKRMKDVVASFKAELKRKVEKYCDVLRENGYIEQSVQSHADAYKKALELEESLRVCNVRELASKNARRSA